MRLQKIIKNMTKQNEELLFKDLCSRLPYGVIVNNNGNQGKLLSIEANPYIGKIIYLIILSDSITADNISNIKPYLRPMSSMTEEEKLDLASIGVYIDDYDDYNIVFDAYDYSNISLEFTVIPYIDFLNKKHFDYRGLIPMGLALPAPDGMYNTKAE